MTRRFEHLDGLRGLAALLVMLHHGIIAFDFALYSGDPAESLKPWDIWLSGAPFMPVLAASLAVCIFFALSGFVLAGAFESAALGLIPLVIKRYLRLAIPVAAVCMLSYVLLSMGWIGNHGVAVISRSSWLAGQFQQTPSLLDAVRESALALSHNFGMAQSYDSALWTMPIEFAGSLLILVMCATAKLISAEPKRRRLIYVFASAAIYLIFARSYLGLFGAGAFLRQLPAQGWPPLRRRVGLAVGLCVGGMFVGAYPVGKAPWPIFAIFPMPHAAPAWSPWPVTEGFFWHTIGAILILAGLQSWDRAQRFFRRPPLQWLGQISFPLYLAHIPILMSVGCGVFQAAHLGGLSYGGSALAALCAFAAVSLVLAQILTLTVERFALSLSARAARGLDALKAPLARRWRAAAES